MELLERQQCLADLAEWLHGAVERGGCVAFVAGEAGIGKTALVQAFFQPAERGAGAVGSLRRALHTRPLAPLRDIVRQAKGAARVSPGYQWGKLTASMAIGPVAAERGRTTVGSAWAAQTE